MTPILSFFPCADVSDTSERANTSVATISPHTKRIDRYGNMRSSQRASVGNRSARALEVARRTMSRGWPARSPTFVGMRPAATARDAPGGDYRFLPGIAPFSSGVVALPGYQVVHVTLRAPIPWRDGFALIDRTSARRAGRAPRCAPSSSEARRRSASRARCVQRRLPRALLTEWKSFAYTPPGATPRPTLVVAGAGEMRERGVGVQGIVRHGETSPEAMREKARYVMGVMQARLSGLGADWPDVTMVDVYTVRPLDTFVADTVLQPAGAAAIHGVRWFPSRPPLVGLGYEMDLRGVVRELV